MITKTQKQFNKDYLFIRKQMVSGKMSKYAVRIWMKLRANNVVNNIEVDLSSKEIQKLLGNQSGFSKQELNYLHNDEEEEQ